MPRFHLKPTTCLALVMGLIIIGPMIFCETPDILAQAIGRPTEGHNVALLSVLDPDAAYSTASSASPTYPVQQASYQDPGIVRQTAVPRPSRSAEVDATFPYALTATKTVAIHAGPGSTSYATDHMQPGEKVLVYRHDPDGWLAIRPPAGSFSLVKANETRRTSIPAVFAIVNNKTKVWVGTRVEQSHEPIFQVQLKAGDSVKVQSTIEVESAAGKQVWLQIDPPAGEFRWVHESEFQEFNQANNSFSASHQGGIVRSSPAYSQTAYPQTDHATLRTAGGSQFSAQSSDPSYGDLELSDVPPLELSDTAANSDIWRAAQRDTPEYGYSEYGTRDSSPSDNQLANAESNLGQQTPFQNVGFQKNQTQNQQQAASAPVRAANEWDEAVRRLSQNERGFYQDGNNSVGSTPGQTGLAASNSLSGNASQSQMTADNWNQHLNLLNQNLSHEIVKPAEQWSLAPLLQQSQLLIQSAPSPAQRDAAATLQKRILGFLQLQKQTPGNNDLTAGVGGARYASAGGSYLPASRPNVSPVQQVNYENPYAAVGYLKELIIDRGRQPNSYVLQDAAGKTLCHVSPLPGVQLHQYLDQKIGVKGTPGYHAQLKLPHVTVETIDKLD